MDTKRDDTTELTESIRIRLIRMKAQSAGMVTGLLMAAGLFVATNWLVLKGGADVGQHLRLLDQYFIGYSVTFVGSLIGAAYAFVVGFLCGFAVALMYNWLAGRRGGHAED